jgi:hypothetical protein
MSEPVWVPLGAQPPGGKELAYVERTTNLSVSATTAPTANEIIAVTIECDGQPIWIEFSTPIAEATQYVSISLWDGPTDLGVLGGCNAVGGNENTALFLRRKLTPTPGVHTFSVRAYRGTTSATIYGGLGGPGLYMPIVLRVVQRDVVPNVVPVGAPPLVTALPGSPVDGQEIILTDSLTAGTHHWHLRYVAVRATNKWVFIGGAGREAVVATNEGLSGGAGAYADCTTVGPSITVPVSGVYEVRVGAMFNDTGAAQQKYVEAGAGVGAFTTPIVQAVGWFRDVANLILTVQQARSASLVAGNEIRVRYKREWTSSVDVSNRTLVLIPIAIGG